NLKPKSSPTGGSHIDVQWQGKNEVGLAARAAMLRARSSASILHCRGDEIRALRKLRRVPSDSTASSSASTRLPRCHSPCLWVQARQRWPRHAGAAAHLGHKNIQHTVRYTEMAPDRFKDFSRG